MSDNNTKETLPPVGFEDEEVLVDIDDESMASEESSVAEMSVGKDETKFVSRFRILLLFLLICTALAVSLVSYYMSRSGEQEEFESAVESHATKIIETFESEAVEKRTALIQLSRELTSHALFANYTWPFVHLPDWELRAMLTRELADVIGIFVLPLVTKDNLEAWSNYTVANQDWLWEGMAIQEMYFGVKADQSVAQEFFESEDEEHTLEVDGNLFQFDEEYEGDTGDNEEMHHVAPDDAGPFFPVWQYSPPIPVPVVNVDWRTMPSSKAPLDSYLNMAGAKKNLVGPSWDFGVGTEGGLFVDLLLQSYSGTGFATAPGGRRKAKIHYEGGPLSYYYIPIMDSFGPDSKLVGVLMSFVFWETYFERLLPKEAVGIQVVVENTCNQSFTFGVSGPDATFLGYGDLHDPKYDDYGYETDFGAFLQIRPDKAVEDGGCLYKIHVYPTQEMEDKHVTNQPLTICLSILGVFVFTTLCFVLYDHFVERRQRLVMKSAQESGNVVSKLFPEEVRDRLYQEGNKGQQEPTECKKKQFLQSVVRKRRSSVESADASSASDPLQGASPIADEYPNCTVFFADLAGFTKWSSTRTPSEVFLLLETVYGTFDKVAKRLGVFKIETIGDCYVAVTGLPKPQQDHAIIMCKFAASCIFKFNQLVHGENLLLNLGDDTANLQMRVGMHSGAVTAGVLRGAKARFQLFGDTVNTASRMESNGQKGKIQVSQATADILVAAGKERWLTPREELVEAKGKGAMQTYWVDVGSDPSMRSSITSSRSHGSGDDGPVDSASYTVYEHQTEC